MATNKLHIRLRPTVVTDLETLFEFQLDKEGGYLAAFMPSDSTDQVAYLAKHTQFLSNPSMNYQTILMDDVIVGSISKFMMEGEAEITYWIAKKYWGHGIATHALQYFFELEATRPIYGRVAFDNFGSQRVLEKCNFIQVGVDTGYARARHTDIEEFIYKLEK